MAHTIPYALVFPTHLVDALDAAWLKDELPDDDVPLPDGVDPPVEPDAGDVGGGDTGPAEEDRWTELGLGELNVS